MSSLNPDVSLNGSLTLKTYLSETRTNSRKTQKAGSFATDPFIQHLSTGDISLAKKLVATFPSKTYQLTAFVYDSQACNYGSCQFRVSSTFTNYVSIVVLLLKYVNH